MNNASTQPLDEDTIVAVATPAGRGGISIVRISGKKSRHIAEKMTGKNLVIQHATFSSIKDKNGLYIDEGIVVFFASPKSFTGEDVVELQVHGNPIILDLIINAAIVLGARAAKPGEFSERAFLNNKIDLTQAEAVADLIAAETVSAAKSAQASLRGVFSKEINILIEQLIALRVYVEAALDFPDEEIDFLNQGKIIEKISGLDKNLNIIFDSAKQGSLINEGMTVVIAGKPNAGKSSLLNALAGHDSAIVTPIAGTTRDVLRESIQLDGMPLHIIDTAGLRETNDPIEKEGVRRAINEIQKADRILFVVDSTEDPKNTIYLKDVLAIEVFPYIECSIPITTVFNKCDISGLPLEKTADSVNISAKKGMGLDLLKTHLKEKMGFGDAESGRYSARRRHIQSLKEAAEHIIFAREKLLQKEGGELIAEELRLAQRALEIITGRFTPDDLLDKIFRDFCIGK